MGLAKEGFTLVELAIGIAVFAIAACGVLPLYIYTSSIAESAGEVISVMNMAKAELENNILTANFDNLSSYSVLSNNLHGESTACEVVNYGGNADLKQVVIAISYRNKSGRVVGEDQNLNGQLDAGEDTNLDARLSSPCQIFTVIRREE